MTFVGQGCYRVRAAPILRSGADRRQSLATAVRFIVRRTPGFGSSWTRITVRRICDPVTIGGTAGVDPATGQLAGTDGGPTRATWLYGPIGVGVFGGVLVSTFDITRSPSTRQVGPTIRQNAPARRISAARSISGR